MQEPNSAQESRLRQPRELEGIHEVRARPPPSQVLLGCLQPDLAAIVIVVMVEFKDSHKNDNANVDNTIIMTVMTI